MEQNDQLIEKFSAFLQPKVSLPYSTHSTQSICRTKGIKSNFFLPVRLSIPSLS
jgi:hypothetical protein